MDKDNVIIHVKEMQIHIEPHMYTDHIWVLIPPKYWNDLRVIDGVKKAMEMTLIEQE